MNRQLKQLIFGLALIGFGAIVGLQYALRSSLKNLFWHNHESSYSTDSDPNFSMSENDTIKRTTTVYEHSVYAERCRRTQKVCRIMRNGKIYRLTRWAKTNVSYCDVPKVASTYWINVFRYLHGDTGNDSQSSSRVSSPFDIPRYYTHYGPLRKMKFYHPINGQRTELLANDLRFMFVRDPYQRLWSAYVDKYYLIDFWKNHDGIRMMQLQNKTFNNPGCANNVTFFDFIYFVANSVNLRDSNLHWRPIHYLCSPCLYQPHVIGKIESFSSDAAYILKRLDMSWIMEDYEHKKHVMQEMLMLIRYNWRVMHGHVKGCIGEYELAMRMWKTFQINGYIPENTSFPFLNENRVTEKQFSDAVLDTFRNSSMKYTSESRLQRQRFFVDAFKDISLDGLKKVRQKYSLDFELFDYEPEPDYLFKDRR